MIVKEGRPGQIRMVIRDVWDAIRDDHDAGDPRDWQPRIDDNSRWYSVFHNGELIGVYWAHKQNHVTWEVHANVLRKWWGQGVGRPATKKALDHIFEDTDAQKCVCTVPSYCTQVLEMCEAIGFEREGIRRKSWQRDGDLYDEIYLGINRN